MYGEPFIGLRLAFNNDRLSVCFTWQPVADQTPALLLQ